MPDDIELIFRERSNFKLSRQVVGDEGQGYYSYNRQVLQKRNSEITWLHGLEAPIQ